ncbi:hypothetical protein CCZ01_06240 [Helicobacter monodelphidis]|uniref:hypothetical protein n=1 Tax=Helicobacter sp. 15-1451 TaxID=2004995 RepID=UPI000DCD8FF1|nr:hypothetical protein [Helicobacter sp. 15-1451]RAX57434.1 hypothetical protein CCZ01_06240 [Helicobacter sp. 15-1451]
MIQSIHQIQSQLTILNHQEPTSQSNRFNDILNAIKQKDSTLPIKSILPSLEDKESVARENLAMRIEIAQQEIAQEIRKGQRMEHSVKAVVGLVNQDFWRQAFSPAIENQEKSNNPTLSLGNDHTQVGEISTFADMSLLSGGIKDN